MGKLVVLRIGAGDFEQGFPVMVQVAKEGQPPHLEVPGHLPPAPDVPDRYAAWQHTYYQLSGIRLTAPALQVTNVSLQEITHRCESTARTLESALKTWFQQSDFRDLREVIQEEVGREDRARIVVQTQDSLLRRLPWQLWDLLERRPQAEIALSADYAPASQPLRCPIQILGILGDDDGIDLAHDRTLLSQFPGARVTWLDKPRRQELSDRLFSQRWDILFFAGHSSSQGGGELRINATESLPLHQVRNALRHAIKQGLKLAIFNSCDGLELARSLAGSQLPQVIVMREPVPDVVAQMFLKYFLAEIANGSPFFLAVRHAREQLQWMEKDYPCATWLPVLCQNPSTQPLCFKPRRPRWSIAVGMGVASLAIGLMAVINQPKSPNLWASRLSLGDKILIPKVTTANKQTGVDAYRRGHYSWAEESFRRSLQQVRNDPETMIYLNNAAIADRPALRIAASVPIGSNVAVAEEILRGVAQAQDEINQAGGIQGKLLQVVIANDENQADIATDIATTLIQDPATLAVVGSNASDASVAAAPVYDQGQLVMISPTSYSDRLSLMGRYIFRMVPTISSLTRTLSRYIVQSHTQARIAICNDPAAIDNQSYRDQFISAIEENGGQFVNVVCDFAAPDFDPKVAVSRIISSGATGILLLPHIDRIHYAIEVARTNQGRLPLFGSSTMNTARTLEEGQRDVNGLVVPVPWSEAESSTRHPFAAKARVRWGGPVNWRTANAYDATWVVAAGLQHRPTRQGLQKTLVEPQFTMQGTTGEVSFLTMSGTRRWVPQIGSLVQVRPIAGNPVRYGFVPLDPRQK